MDGQEVEAAFEVALDAVLLHDQVTKGVRSISDETGRSPTDLLGELRLSLLSKRGHLSDVARPLIIACDDASRDLYSLECELLERDERLAPVFRAERDLREELELRELYAATGPSRLTVPASSLFLMRLRYGIASPKTTVLSRAAADSRRAHAAAEARVASTIDSNRQYLRRRTAYSVALERVSVAKKDLIEGLERDILLPEANRWLSAQVSDFDSRFRTNIEVSSYPSGLSARPGGEMCDLSSGQVDLSDYLKRFNSATIGVSGPRGSGKTTMLEKLVLPRVGESWPLRVAVFEPIPTNYNFREFLLHLYARLCREVLRDSPSHRINPSLPSPKMRVTQLAVAGALVIVGYTLFVIQVSTQVATPQVIGVCVVLPITVAVVTQFSINAMSWYLFLIGVAPLVVLAVRFRDLPLAGQLYVGTSIFWSALSFVSLVWNSSRRPSSTAQLYRRWFSSPGTIFLQLALSTLIRLFVLLALPSALVPQFVLALVFSVVLTFSGVAIAEFRARTEERISLALGVSDFYAPISHAMGLGASLLSPLALLGVLVPLRLAIPALVVAAGLYLYAYPVSRIRAASRNTGIDAELPRSGPGTAWKEVQDAASERLESITFQQTTTVTSTNALKLGASSIFSAGWDRTASRQVALARTPLTVPELVSSFRTFAKLVGQERRVVFCLDELDKMTVQSASDLLNDVKVLFEIDRCYFFISVSEDAVASFEARGLPARDVFDSSFDEVVRVDPILFPESRQILDSRVVALPIAYVALAHCLSAGLPRELIRVARSIFTVILDDKVPSSIPAVTRAVVALERLARLRGLEHDARLAYQKDNASLSSTLLVLDSLKSDSWVGQAPIVKVASLLDGDHFAQTAMCLTYFLQTVLELFSSNSGVYYRALTQESLNGSIVDAVARARTEIRRSPALAWSQLDEVRIRSGLAVWSGLAGPSNTFYGCAQSYL